MYCLILLTNLYLGGNNNLQDFFYKSLTTFNGQFGSRAKMDFPASRLSHTLYFISTLTSSTICDTSATEMIKESL